MGYSDRDLMRRAIEISRKCESEPGKISPKVGAVIARNGQIIGEAYRGEMAPGEHAEFTLLERKLAYETLAGATLYVTLEPCTSRNEPKIACAERIVERRIAKVFIGVLDPNEKIRGSGELYLRDANVQIARFDSDLMPTIEELNREFSRQHRSNLRRQHTTAETADPVERGQLGPNGHRIGYKVGDKVRLERPLPRTVKAHPSLSVGDEGIVVQIKEAGKDGYSGYDIQSDISRPLLYGIDWGKPIGGNLDCEGRCKGGYGSYVEPEEITVS
jgi:pyrimidine deaminase RibD-like protein